MLIQRRRATLAALVVLLSAMAVSWLLLESSGTANGAERAAKAHRMTANAARAAASSLAGDFRVFDRARTADDAMPFDPRGSNPFLRDLYVDQSRLALNTADARVWLVPQGGDVICMISKFADSASMACTTTESGTNPATPLVDLAGKHAIALLPNGVRSATTQREDGARVPATAQGVNVAFVSDATKMEVITLATADGSAHTQALRPAQAPATPGAPAATAVPQG